LGLFAIHDTFFSTFTHRWFGYSGMQLAWHEEWTRLQTLKNALFLLCPLPVHYFFTKFMWTFARQREYLWLLLTPINLLASVFSDVASIQLLGTVGLVYGIAAILIERNIQTAGKRII